MISFNQTVNFRKQYNLRDTNHTWRVNIQDLLLGRPVKNIEENARRSHEQRTAKRVREEEKNVKV